jgi:hypothetical protein
VFSDHTDVRPTLMALLGLKDDYVHDGRVLAEWLESSALPQGIKQRQEDFIELAEDYKQLNAARQIGPKEPRLRQPVHNVRRTKTVSAIARGL